MGLAFRSIQSKRLAKCHTGRTLGMMVVQWIFRQPANKRLQAEYAMSSFRFVAIALVFVSQTSITPGPKKKEPEQLCRTYATEFEERPAHTISTCQFDEAALEYRCTKSSGDFKTRVYASARDFVMEGIHRERAYAIRTRFRSDGKDWEAKLVYTDDGYLAREENTALPHVVLVWDKWDASGRNTAGRMEVGKICSLVSSVEYKDTDHASFATFGFEGEEPAGVCKYLKARVDRFYDENEILIREVTSIQVSDTKETIYTIKSTQKFCVVEER